MLHQSPQQMGLRCKAVQYLEQSVAHWIMDAGPLAVMLPTLNRGGEVQRGDIQLDAYVDMLDGLVLQGGVDISPEYYGERPVAGVISDAVRDRFELDLLRAFHAAGKPVFGICRGMQLINVAFGGTLYQDLEQAGVQRIPHNHPDRYDTNSHAVRLVADSTLARLYPGAESFEVTSIHHQAVKELGKGLQIEAWSVEDEVVEALRLEDDDRFVFGVQWHPEFHGGGLMDCRPLLQEFLAYAARVAKLPTTV